MRPVMLDLYSGAGGCAKGYQRAGFYVVGVDVEPQPHYCGDEFVQDDAIEYVCGHFSDFDAISASPPCQHYANVTLWRGDQGNHPALIGPTREALKATGLPYVIENVRTSELQACFVLCGSMFGLPIRRHRYFETNWAGLHLVPPCQHRPTDLAFEHKQERAYADAMGCEWMSSKEAREAVPPAYTQHIGTLLLAQLTKAAA